MLFRSKKNVFISLSCLSKTGRIVQSRVRWLVLQSSEQPISQTLMSLVRKKASRLECYRRASIESSLNRVEVSCTGVSLITFSEMRPDLLGFHSLVVRP